MSQRLLNRVAVITGASGGLGRAIAEKFLVEGARVVLLARRGEPLQEIAARAPARTHAAAGDVTQSADLEQLVAATLRRFGRVDSLVAAAGEGRKNLLCEEGSRGLQEVFQTNVFGAAETVRHFAPHLPAGGSILLITSGLPINASTRGLGGFLASKAALSAMTRVLAAELAPRQIRVNAIAPGPADTSFWKQPGLQSAESRALLDRLASRTTTGQPVCPQDIAEAAVFLTSDSASHLTGQELVIDGGFSIGH